MPAVSIITPVLIDIPDKIVWLDEMLQSVLSQTMQDWEVILVDDFSPILIGELKWKYQEEKRFRWFRTAGNSGPAKTRNVAVALAESEAILPLDSDDALATDTALQRMYDTWQADKTKIVYGNLQWLEIKDGKFQRSKTYMLDPYTFKNAMNLGGIIPVTAMHSMACHVAAGGWKSELEFGREDVEYIINTGKLGFCGQKIEETTLLYRKHDYSRDYKLKYNHSERDARDKIREIHSDIFNGRFPVGCCGQNTNTNTSTLQSNNQSQSRVMSTSIIGDIPITRLPEGKYKEEDTWWVEYYGGKKAQFQIFGRNSRETYTIRGTGHIFQIHVDDKLVFTQRSRQYRNAQKLEYLRPEPPPVPVAEPQIELQLPTTQVAQHNMAIIERLDKKAMESRGLPIVTEEQLPRPVVTEVQLPTDTKLVDVGASRMMGDFGKVLPQAKIHNLSDLDLGAFEEVLKLEGWTVQSLAEAEIGDLTGYKGIGNNRAKSFIDQAKSLINQT